MHIARKNHNILCLLKKGWHNILCSVILLLQDFNNTDLMKELQKQDSEYLEKIIKQNKEILEILKRKEEK